MHLIDATDIKIFVTIATIMFLLLFIVWKSSNWLNVFIKLVLGCMVGFGFILMVGFYSA